MAKYHLLICAGGCRADPGIAGHTRVCESTPKLMSREAQSMAGSQSRCRACQQTHCAAACVGALSGAQHGRAAIAKEALMDQLVQGVVEWETAGHMTTASVCAARSCTGSRSCRTTWASLPWQSPVDDCHDCNTWRSLIRFSCFHPRQKQQL